MPRTSNTTWPRHRLQLRSVISAAMSIGWTWVAATALIPYFLIGRGRGAGSIEFLGIARTEWLGFHVWSSIVIGLLTLAHVVLNRRGLTRSYRVVAGVPTRAIAENRPTKAGRRRLTWVAALALVTLAIGGSFVFGISGEPAGGGGGQAEARQEVDAGSSNGGGDPIRVPGSGYGYRGGRGAGDGS